MMSAIHSAIARTWHVGPERVLTLDRPRLMGILNVTPDSFSDGGQHVRPGDALAAARRMMDEGAMIIDVGGESTRPGAARVDADEQIRRTVPVIQLIAGERGAARAVLISIDTTIAAVAEAALDSGADIINDVSAGLDDSLMLSLAASRACGLILMHRLRPPVDDSFSTSYTKEPDYRGDVYGVVRDFLHARANAAIDAGVRRNSIVIDPGLGFGKSVAQNYELASRAGQLQNELDLPVLSAASRKSFLAQPPHRFGSQEGQQALPRDLPPPTQRLGASIAITLSHWQVGLQLFRVHDVAAHAQALAAASALNAEQTRPAAG